MASYNGTLVDSPHRAEDTLRCSASIVTGLDVHTITMPPDEISTLESVSQGSYTYVQQNELEIAYTGVYVNSFLQDYYYRVHISPSTIAFGPIVNPVQEEFIIWNAWFVSKTLSSIDEDNPSEYVLDPSTTPLGYMPLEHQTYTVDVDTDGVTEFVANLIFNFDTETPTLILTGTRVAVFPFEPLIPMMESLEWLTNIIRAKDGSEQRISIRPVPRQGFQFNCFLKDEQEQARLDALLFNWLKKTWAIPIWGEWEEHTSDINADDTVISVNTLDTDFRDDSYAIIWQGFDSYESVKIETVSTAGLTLEKPVLNNWTGKKWIMPLRIGFMISPVKWTVDADGFGHFNCSFTITDNYLLDTYVAEQSYGGLPVLPATLEDGGLENEIDGDITLIDYGIDRYTQISDSDFNIYVQRHVFRNEGKENIWAFREFLHYLYGRRNPVWILSDKEDFVQTTTLGASETELRVTNVGWARQMGLNNLRTHIAFIFSDGTVMCREITGFTESGSEDIIGISSALGVQIEPGDCTICLLDKCRLTDDKVEIEWEESFKIKSKINFTKVKE